MKRKGLTIGLVLVTLVVLLAIGPPAGASGAPRRVDGDGNGTAICDIGAYKSQPPTLNIRAFVDGRSHMILQGDTVYWHHLDFAAPGRHGGVDEPTYLNGTAWYPTWPDVPDPENRWCDCDSSSFVGVPCLAAQTQTVALGVVQARGSVVIVQQPDESNGYTLIIEFDDNAPGGPDWYEINLVYATAEPSVALDIKPGSCPNPLNVRARGVLPVAILGRETFDVTQIDPGSVALEGVAPLRWSLEDVATPFEPFIGKEDAYDCNEYGPDGYVDLTFKFVAQEIVGALGDVNDGDVLVLQLTGNLKEEFGGLPFVGEDVVIVLKKK